MLCAVLCSTGSFLHYKIKASPFLIGANSRFLTVAMLEQRSNLKSLQPLGAKSAAAAGRSLASSIIRAHKEQLQLLKHK